MHVPCRFSVYQEAPIQISCMVHEGFVLVMSKQIMLALYAATMGPQVRGGVVPVTSRHVQAVEAVLRSALEPLTTPKEDQETTMNVEASSRHPHMFDIPA